MIAAFVLVAATATITRAVLTVGQTPSALPWRTLLVNVIGTAILGFLVGAGRTGHLVTFAGLGSLTTFSTVAAETAALLDNRERIRAATYVSLSVGAGLLAALIGLTIGENS